MELPINFKQKPSCFVQQDLYFGTVFNKLINDSWSLLYRQKLSIFSAKMATKVTKGQISAIALYQKYMS